MGAAADITLRREIFRLAIPSIIANITTPLLGMVDLAIVGHLGSAVYIGAIALGGTIFSMVYWVFAFLRMGTSGLTARAVGRSDFRERDLLLMRSLLLSLAIGLLLLAIHRPLFGLMMKFMGSEPPLYHQASLYFNILIYGAPATLGLYALHGWFIGVQRPRLSMSTSIIVNLVNILVSLLLVYGAGMKVAGVAVGSLAAQWTGLGAALLMARRLRPSLAPLRRVLDPDALRRFFTVNTDIFLRTVCLVAVTVWFTRAGSQQGAVILAANALLMQLFLIDSYFMDGFAYAAEAIIGRLTGSGDLRRRRRAIAQFFTTGSLLSLLLTIIYAASGSALLGLLSDDAEVVAAAADYRWWAVTIPFAAMGAFIWDGVFIGAGKSRGMLLSMAIATATFFGVYFSLFPVMGNHALWLAFILYLIVRGGVQTLLSL